MAKLLFIQSLFVEQFGIMTLSAVAKAAGHTVDLAIGSDNHILEKAKAFKPDIVGFSVLTGFQMRYLKLGNALKTQVDSTPLILFGGPHPTFFPEIILEKGVDLVCCGEGEGAIVDILDAVQNKTDLSVIPNVVLKKRGGMKEMPMRSLVNLDEAPFPDREIYKDYPVIYNAEMITFMASRGCPFNCSFCFNKEMKKMVKECGTWVRFRSAQNLIAEIEAINQHKPIKYIDFHDDTFILKKKWLLEFLEIYKKKFTIPFSCLVRADLTTPDVAKALKEAGCDRVCFGLESGDEKLRNNVLQKELTDDQIREGAAVLNDVGLSFFTTNMMGLPGETLEEAIKTLQLNIDIGTKCAWTSVFQPFPGTRLAQHCLEKGYLDKSISTDQRIDTHTDSQLNQLDINKIVNLQKFAYIIIRFPSSLGFVKKIIHYNFPKIYFYIHRISYLLLYFRKAYQTSLFGTVKHALLSWRYY